MIIVNGYIQIKQTTEKGINPDTGHPYKPTSSWGEPIECQYIINKYNAFAQSKVGNVFTEASYQILIEEQAINAESIKLTDNRGNELGVFSVIRVEPLPAVCQLRLWI